jgi:hypothetical protein
VFGKGRVDKAWQEQVNAKGLATGWFTRPVSSQHP